MLMPPRAWRVPVIMTLGTLSGLGLFLIYISRAYSYMSDDPAACVNCHLMKPYYSSWQHSAHGRVATCNDCHVPHDNVFRSYMFKARDGLWHSTVFTMRWEPQSIAIGAPGKRVVNENCIRCHRSLFSGDQAVHLPTEGEFCWKCHRETPHGTRASLSSAPDNQAPDLGSMLPWNRPKTTVFSTDK